MNRWQSPRPQPTTLCRNRCHLAAVLAIAGLLPWQAAATETVSPDPEPPNGEPIRTHAITGKPSSRSSDVWSLLTQYGLAEEDFDSGEQLFSDGEPAASHPVLADTGTASDAGSEPASEPVTVPATAAETDVAPPAPTEVAQAGEDDAYSADPSKASSKELSQQTANPVGRFAFIFTQVATTFKDGDANNGNAKVAGEIVFQPIIPIPLIGTGEDEWRIVTRPTIALFIQNPAPRPGFGRQTGISDMLIPLPLALPPSIAGRWLAAVGPGFSFPTATDDDFGVQQWTVGPTGVFGYIAKNWMAGAYPQYYFGVADAGRADRTKDASFGNMFYWFLYNITDEWQVGWNPTITFDNKATRGNRWNVPVGFLVSRVTKIFGKPFRWEFGVEYSVVNQDDFGEVARIKVNLLPIVQRPIKKPLLGFLSRLGGGGSAGRRGHPESYARAQRR